ncbi:MAG: 7-carboxy-7-deazaguanine synthase [Rhodothermales bacterium]
MAYAVKEIFYSLQGEGLHAGRPAVFLRFSGCNLWSGREQDRATAICQFCDTDFFGTNGSEGGKYGSAKSLADQVSDMWPVPDTAAEPSGKRNKYVVCSGGEPLLQLDDELIKALKARGFEVAVETNGTVLPPDGLDWICVSPKAGAETILVSGNELKLVYPQKGAAPETFEGLAFDHFFLQPMDGPALEENTQLTLNYCLENPKWRLSIQSHKLLQIQ